MLTILTSFVILASASLLQASPQTDEAVLAPGSPPLTREMAEHRIHVQEVFLDVHLTAEQRQKLEEALVDVWRRHDREEVQHALEDLRLYGNDDAIRNQRSSNLESYVENLRRHPGDLECETLLAAFEAAHPDHRDVMHARGEGELVGEWQTGDALAPQVNRFTGRAEGISFSEALVLKIFSDGRFHHEWVHRHCNGGVRCCNEMGTSVDGSVAVDGSRLTLNGEGGRAMSKDPCIAANNIDKALGAESRTFEWSLKHDASGAAMLCLSGRPFQFAEKTDPVCYRKAK